MLVDLVARILALVPPWTRVYRVQVRNVAQAHYAGNLIDLLNWADSIIIISKM